MDISFTKDRVSKISEIIEYFKTDSYNLHKFVALIKKPKTIKLLQEDFYFTLIHYIVLASMWLEYDKVQQLWHSISWLKIIKNNKTHSTLILAIKEKERKPILKRLTSSVNSGMSIKPKLRRSSTINLLKIEDEDTHDSEDLEIKNTELQILFNQTSSQMVEYSAILMLGGLTAIDILKLLNERPWIDYHVDFDKSYVFLYSEIKSYFN